LIILHLLKNLGGNIVGAPRPRRDIVEPPGQQIFGPRLIPYPLADRSVHNGAGARS
jgi:hypothetical protein